ncbi:hypothetical protein Pcinc_000742 [Petrolisthes cinctipes]|uniref:C-type lectin domain-containing protein n=1 Tax=Petrolisthes cinctipes TaxID=88211 RepID=A0AAE1GN31_PETCI|nr:hypothetical protein Pcinc_000742 [Petrolisthes cinctipes]
MTGLVVQTFLLALWVSGLNAIQVTAPPQYSNIINKQDVEVNLMVNQLAILKLMDSISAERVSAREHSLEDALRQLREDMVTALQDTKTTLQQQLTSYSTEDESERECAVAVEEELAKVKEDQATLMEQLARTQEELTVVKRTLAESEKITTETETEVTKLRSDVATLNTTLNQPDVNKERELEVSMHSELATLKEGQARLEASLTTLQASVTKPNDQCKPCINEGQLQLINCSITYCKDGCLTPHIGYSDYSLSSEAIGEKCAHYHVSSKTWDSARDICRATGGDLIVARNHTEELYNFLTRVNYGSTDAWVGIKNNKWLDGQEVATEMWSRGQPNDGPDSCGFIRSSNNKLRDAPCTSTGNFVCLSGVYH